MSKVVLQDIGSGYNLTTVVNNNNQFIEEAFENTLSRDGTDPNSMEAALDMNSHRIINLGAPIQLDDAVRLRDIVDGDIEIHSIPEGGTTGQALVKASNSDYDVEWATVSEGGGVDTDDQTAAEVPYSNATSGLTANDVQEAIDELVVDIEALDTDIEEITYPVVIQMSCSDLTTELTAGSNKAYVRAAQAFTLQAVRASLLTASTSGAVTIDINLNGPTILSTKLTIDANEFTSVSAATPPVLISTSISSDDMISVDIDSAGADAAGLIVTLIGITA